MANFLVKLRERWGQKSLTDVWIVLLVFALTGFSVLFLKKPIQGWLTDAKSQNAFWFSVFYYIAILPVYNLLLLFWGALLGKFQFFWEFEKRFFNRIFKRKPKA